jgi:large subunit ribosomal protein L32
MTNPKRKISKSRRDKRRTHYKGAVPTLSTDSTSGEVHMRHRVTADGFYRGKHVFPDMKSDV